MRILVIIPVLMLLVCSSVRAEELTLEECIAIGLRNNPQIKAAEIRVNEAEQGIGEAWGQFLPTLALSFDKNQVENSGGSGSDTDFINQESERVSVQLTQPVFSGLSGVAGLTRARLSKRFSSLAALGKQRELVLGVSSNFYDVLLAKELVNKRAASVGRLEEQVKIAEAWVEQSLAPRIRLLEVQVELSNARQELISARADLSTAKTRLAEWLAFEGGRQDEIVGDLQDRQGTACPDVDVCLDMALQERLEMELARLNIEVARQDIKMITARNLPQAKLSLGWTDYQRDFELDRLTDDDRDYFTATFNISVQPFQGGRNIYARRRQKAAVERLQQDLIAQKNTILTEVISSYDALQDSRARLDAVQDSLAEAEEAYQLTRRSVELGVSSLRDLLDTELLLTRAEINLINSQHAVQRARLKLNYAVGEPTYRN